MSRETVAIEHYRELVQDYDRATRRIESVRQRAIALLGLQAGDTVVDVACGTGISLPRLSQAVGARGRVIGVDLSPHMLAAAAKRVRHDALANVTLIESSIENVTLPGPADAFLFNYTHDVLQSEAALSNLFRQATPRARVSACGTKLFPAWFLPGNLWLLFRHRRYLTTYAGIRQPWRVLKRHAPDLAIAPVLTGRSYVAVGRLKASETSAQA